MGLATFREKNKAKAEADGEKDKSEINLDVVLNDLEISDKAKDSEAITNPRFANRDDT